MYLYFLGDLHTSDMNPWSLPTGELFLKWFDQQQFEPNSELIQLGDLVEVAVNGGKVFDQLHRFIDLCQLKFKHSYFIVGNHDVKPRRGQEQSVLEFIKSKSNCTVIDRPKMFNTVNDYSIIALPHITTQGIDLNQYYMTKLTTKYYDTQVDILAAHTNIRIPGHPFMDSGLEISKFKAKNFIFGHIHTRIKPEYTGSVWPNKINEEASSLPRQIRCFKRLNDECIEDSRRCITIPKFIEYKEITYPNSPTNIDPNIIQIYTVNNCSNLQIAKAHYNNLYIRGVNKNVDVNANVSTSNSLFKIEKPIDALKNYMTETKTTLNRPLYNYLVNLLSS